MTKRKIARTRSEEVIARTCRGEIITIHIRLDKCVIRERRSPWQAPPRGTQIQRNRRRREWSILVIIIIVITAITSKK